MLVNIFDKQVLAAGDETELATLDLSVHRAAYLYLGLGRVVAGEPSEDAQINLTHADPTWPEMNVRSGVAAAAATTVAAGVTAGDQAVQVADATGFVVGSHVCLVPAAAAGNYPMLEFAEVVEVAGDVLTLAGAMDHDHAIGEIVTNQAAVLNRRLLIGQGAYQIEVRNPSDQAVALMVAYQVDAMSDLQLQALYYRSGHVVVDRTAGELRVYDADPAGGGTLLFSRDITETASTTTLGAAR
jgi:hypothetical protein